MNNQVINTDKIVIQFRVPINIEINKLNHNPIIQLQRNTDLFNSNKDFNEKWNVYYNSTLYCYLYASPRDGGNYIQLYFHKEINYIEFNRILLFYNEFTSQNPSLEYDGFSKLEICLNSLDSSMWNQIFEIQANRIDSNQYIKPLYQSNSKTKITIHSLENNSEFVICHKNNSSKEAISKNSIANKVVIYKKTNLKYYQTAFYNQNNLNVVDHLYRLEVRLNRKFFSNLKAKGKIIDFEYIFTQSNLVDLFDSAIGDKLQFKELTKPYKDCHRNKKYEILALYSPSKTLKDLKLTNYSKPVYTPENTYKNDCALFRALVKEYLEHPANLLLESIFFVVSVKKVDYRVQIKNLINKGYNLNGLKNLESILIENYN